jgi:hypothetical protein
VVICGGADDRRAAEIAHVALWIFHGSEDDAVPVARSRSIVQALKKAGGSPRFTEYADVGHHAPPNQQVKNSEAAHGQSGDIKAIRIYPELGLKNVQKLDGQLHRQTGFLGSLVRSIRLPRHFDPLLLFRTLGSHNEAGMPVLNVVRNQSQKLVVLQLRLVVVASLTRTVEKQKQRVCALRIVQGGYKQTVGKRSTAGIMVNASGQQTIPLRFSGREEIIRIHLIYFSA